ncbi:MAG: amino acid ABC transporter permease, partial [Rhodobacteraceae bacterium]|nr:amino acid ABC transporter permease [Paracoccaceae bacterium]
MSAITDPPKDGFHLGMLIYDTRYRSLTIQTVALILFLLGVGWLVNNAATNLAALGKPLGFGFLGEAAGYDINQRLIEYNSQMSHGRAAIVGLLNTLLVAVMGCIIATVLGVVIGVLRLSNNWIVARIMTFYIETLR